MKNLATCTPTEFLKQTNKIRKSVDKWLTDTDIMNIRKRMPDIKKDSTAEEIDELTRKQVRANANAILDAVMVEHPEETLEVLALICFVEPKDVDEHPVAEYLEALSEIISNEAVIGFFTSLARWESANGLSVAGA